MEPGGPQRPGPLPVAWDEAREVVALVLTLCAALMAVAPIVFRIIDGQIDRAGFRSAMQGATFSVTGVAILGAAVLVATTPAVDVTPKLRRLVAWTAALIVVLCALHILDLLFAESAGVRKFFLRFPTIASRPLPTGLMAGLAGWLARRVVPFPA